MRSPSSASSSRRSESPSSRPDSSTSCTPTSSPISTSSQRKAESGAIKLTVETKGRENRYYLLNAGKPPFDDPKARLAFALAIDRNEINQLRNLGRATVADGPFDKGIPGYVADPGFPKHNLAKAKKLVKEVKAAHGGRFKVQFVILPDTENRNEAELLKQQIEKAGISADIAVVDQTAEISTAISGDYNVLLWRNHAGEDPDINYVWWHSGELTNFGKINDPMIDRLLEQGRATSDPARARRGIRRHHEGVRQEHLERVGLVRQLGHRDASQRERRSSAHPYPTAASRSRSLPVCTRRRGSGSASELHDRPPHLSAIAMRRITGKLVRLVVVLFLVTFGTFMLVRLFPGDPVKKMIPFGTNLAHAARRATQGDRPRQAGRAAVRLVARRSRDWRLRQGVPVAHAGVGGVGERGAGDAPADPVRPGARPARGDPARGALRVPGGYMARQDRQRLGVRAPVDPELRARALPRVLRGRQAAMAPGRAVRRLRHRPRRALPFDGAAHDLARGRGDRAVHAAAAQRHDRHAPGELS